MANGDLAEAAGLPVVDASEDLRMGYDAINALADALARIITDAWRKGVNTTEDIATTGNVNVNGRITTNELLVQVNLAIGGQVSVTGGINTNGTVAANAVTIAGADVGATLSDLVSRVGALEAAA